MSIVIICVTDRYETSSGRGGRRSAVHRPQMPSPASRLQTVSPNFQEPPAGSLTGDNTSVVIVVKMAPCCHYKNIKYATCVCFHEKYCLTRNSLSAGRTVARTLGSQGEEFCGRRKRKGRYLLLRPYDRVMNSNNNNTMVITFKRVRTN